jgi:putative membrane protein
MSTRSAMLGDERRFFAANAIVSAAALSFLGWLLLIHPHMSSAGSGALAGSDVRFLPAVNAAMNATAAGCLCAGYVAIRRGARALHRTLMVAAFAASSVFLVGYLVYHFVHGDTSYVGPGRPFYLALLMSHVLLSMSVVPLALTSFYFALTGKLEKHRRVAKVTLPIWLYVSVTGVVLFFVLRTSPTAR